MIERRPFGRTGHESSRAVFGGVALSKADAGDADRVLDLLLRYGVNHIDTAADYGKAEENIGRWMGRHRSDFFLATKASGRNDQEVRDSVHRSLDRLRVDHVDLLQMHNLVDPVEWRHATNAGGALEALIEAREDGLARYLGVTGHGLAAPRMHLRSLERHDFDAVLLPCNYMLLRDPCYRDPFTQLAAECATRHVALQTIKSIAQGTWDKRPGKHNTWYVPLTEQDDIDQAVHWVLGFPEVFLITAGDTHLLPKVLDAAGRFTAPPSDEQMLALVARRGLRNLFE